MIGKYLKRDYLYITAGALIILLSYKLAFEKTVEALQLNRKLDLQVQNISLNVQPAYQERTNKNLNTLLSKYKLDSVKFRDNILNVVSAIAQKEKVQVTEVPVYSRIQSGRSLTQKIVLKGSFFPLLKVMNELEHPQESGLVRSIIIRKKADRIDIANKEVTAEVFLSILKK